MERIKKLHEQLNQIYQCSKNLHWFTSVYSNHLLYDRIADGILDDDDSLIELFLMDLPFHALVVPAPYGKDATKDIVSATLNNLIREAIRQCEVAKGFATVGAASSLLDGIQERLIVKTNLLGQVTDERR